MERIDVSRLVIFTDLDGTMLDRETYSYGEAVPALRLIVAKRVPLVFCSSKTRSEQEWYRRLLGIGDPFIVEDGGAVYIEEDYFRAPFEHHREWGAYRVIEFGRSYREIRGIVSKVTGETGIRLIEYGDMTVDEVAAATGLDPGSASRAMEREYEAQIVGGFGREDKEVIEHAFARYGLRVSRGGRFLGVLGHAGKGEAVGVLSELFRKERGGLVTAGIGDSGNDVPMLAAVDIPVLVRKMDGTWEDTGLENVQRIDGVGPEGWRMFVSQLLA